VSYFGPECFAEIAQINLNGKLFVMPTPGWKKLQKNAIAFLPNVVCKGLCLENLAKASSTFRV